MKVYLDLNSEPHEINDKETFFDALKTAGIEKIYIIPQYWMNDGIAYLFLTPREFSKVEFKT